MTDFDDTQHSPAGMENPNPIKISFLHKRPTDRIGYGEDINDWKRAWRATFQARAKLLGTDEDHSMKSGDAARMTNPTRAQIVETYEAAYSEIVGLLRQVNELAQTQHDTIRSLEDDVKWRRRLLNDLNTELGRANSRFEALMDLVTIANTADHDGETEL